MKQNREMFDINITSLVYGGDGLGRLPDGRAVFVPFSMPGETVRIRITAEKPKYARAVLVEVLAPSEKRISSRCIHYGNCGGCHYQHIPYGEQCRIKTQIIREQLMRIAHISDPPVGDIIPSSSEWNYRNIVQFHLDSSGKPGFWGSSAGEIIPIQECHLPLPPIMDLWQRLDLDIVPGLERIALRADAEEAVQLILESSDPKAPEFAVDFPISAVHLSPEGTIVLSGDEYVIEEVLKREFQVSAGAFFQVNSLLTGDLVNCVLQGIEDGAKLLDNAGTSIDISNSVVLDIYCGVGLFSAFISPLVSRCIGIEANQSAVEDFTVNLDALNNVELYPGEAEDILPVLDEHPDIIIVDPPRGGLSRVVRDAIIRLSPMIIIYISCDPATLGRDARRLIDDNYHLEKITPIDMFPQTFHIESVSVWVKYR